MDKDYFLVMLYISNSDYENDSKMFGLFSSEKKAKEALKNNGYHYDKDIHDWVPNEDNDTEYNDVFIWTLPLDKVY